MDREVKVESSIAVQGRVSIVTLAELDEYWRAHGVHIASMSQLLGWSLDLFRDVLEHGGKLPRPIETVAEAHKHLTDRGLYQRSMRKRGAKKLMQAMMFENLRTEGVDPAEYASRQYKELHNPKSVKPSKKQDINELVEIFNKLGEDE